VNAVRWIVLVAAVEAAATGVILIIVPALFGWLILGAELSEPGQALGRLAGIALFGFGLASWPAPAAGGPTTSTIRALSIYNLLAMICLGYLGIAGKLAGVLLWPAVALHAVLVIPVIYAWRATRQRRRFLTFG
jgi:hypothetical protein